MAAMLKPQDVLAAVVLLDLSDWTYAELAAVMRVSASEAHAAVDRASECGLVDATTRTVRRAAFCEFVVHGLRYVYPARRSGLCRGIPTAHAGPPLAAQFADDDLPPVWPHPEGVVRGLGVEPLFRTVPEAVLARPALHEWFALIDALRIGRARERRLAEAEITKRLSP
jgi:hypothetical protein